MEQKELVYSGILLLPPVGKILIKKSWQQKFCLLFKASKFGIERLEVYDTTDPARNSPSRIITLENCIKITINSPTQFTVTTKTAPFQHEFGTISIQSKNEWLNAFQSVAFPDDSSAITSIEEDNDLYCSAGDPPVFHVKILSSPASERCGLVNKTRTLVLTATAIQLISEQDAMLLYTWPYCYIRRYGYKSGKFTFEAGRKCDSGEGTFILEHPNQQEIFRCLGLKMKSMRKLLKEDSPHQSHHGSSATMLDCSIGSNNSSTDSQLHAAALSMEARSRSPLPLLPTQQPPPCIISTNNNNNINSNIFASQEIVMNTSGSDLNLSSGSNNKIIQMLNLNQESSTNNDLPSVNINDSSKKCPATPVIARNNNKIKPAKPPRKILPSPVKNNLTDQSPPPMQQHSVANKSANFTQNYEPIESNSSIIGKKYDQIEYRKDAWRKLGVGEVDHTENLTALDDSPPEDYMSWGGVKKSLQNISPAVVAPKILPNQSALHGGVGGGGDSSYDKLNFFGSSCKLNSNKSANFYKQMSSLGSVNSLPSPPSFNDYDEVLQLPSSESIESARSADDSHLGYALIRKDNNNGVTNATGKGPQVTSSFSGELQQQEIVNHHFHNDEPYAVISKPKRV